MRVPKSRFTITVGNELLSAGSPGRKVAGVNGDVGAYNPRFKDALVVELDGKTAYSKSFSGDAAPALFAVPSGAADDEHVAVMEGGRLKVMAPDGASGLKTVLVAGDRHHNIMQGLNVGKEDVARLAWSPDGKTLFFSLSRWSTDARHRVFDTETGAVRRLFDTQRDFTVAEARALGARIVADARAHAQNGAVVVDAMAPEHASFARILAGDGAAVPVADVEAAIGRAVAAFDEADRAVHVENKKPVAFQWLDHPRVATVLRFLKGARGDGRLDENERAHAKDALGDPRVRALAAALEDRLVTEYARYYAPSPVFSSNSRYIGVLDENAQQLRVFDVKTGAQTGAYWRTEGWSKDVALDDDGAPRPAPADVARALATDRSSIPVGHGGRAAGDLSPVATRFGR
jgi:hypothetical protein